MEDNIYAHKSFQRAARGALSLYLSVLDKPAAGSEETTVDMNGLSAAERKKEKAKLKKQQKKAAAAKEAEEKEKIAAAAAAQEQAVANARDKDGDDKRKVGPPKDEDPEGTRYLSLDPTEELAKWATSASRCLSQQGDPDTLALVAEVWYRRRKVVLLTRALSVGLRACPKHPALTVQLVRLALAFEQRITDVSSIARGLNAVVEELVEAELSDLTCGLSASAYVSDYARWAPSLGVPHRVAAARCLLMIDNTSNGRSGALSLLTDSSLWEGRGVTLPELLAAHKVTPSTWPCRALSYMFYRR